MKMTDHSYKLDYTVKEEADQEMMLEGSQKL